MGKFGKSLLAVRKEAMVAWQKFANPSVGRGKTLFPKGQNQLQKLGVRFDYDGEVERDGAQFHKFQIQPNAGKIPTSIEQWRQKNGGTHAVMGTAYVKTNATEEEVEAGLTTAFDGIEGM